MRKRLICSFLLVLQAFIIMPAFTQDYSFFVAGHTYGDPYNPQYGLYPPFVDKIDFINEYSGMAFGCLTGDVVVQPTSPYWDAAQEDMADFNFPLHIAAGNHDIGSEFVERFGDYYYSFFLHDDLFIVLAPSLGNWSITGDQKDFLFSTLEEDAADANKIFVFLHELIWWSPDSIFQNIVLNYIPSYPGNTNFFTEIEPVFHALPNQVVFFAGDLGATIEVSPYMYYTYDNITLIASGMGGGIEDNMLVVDVVSDTIIYHLIALNGEDINGLGDLTDFSLEVPIGVDKEGISGWPVSPNPVNDLMCVDCRVTGVSSELVVCDLGGRVVLREFFPESKLQEINVQQLPGGLYVFRLKGAEGVQSGKIVKL